MKWCYAKWLIVALLIVGWAASVAALAQEAGEEKALSNRDKYQSCISVSHQTPQVSFDEGMKWRDEGGGLPAQHCVALALVKLGLYEEAAQQLDVVANDLRRGKGLNFAEMTARGDRKVLADIYMQAGNVWLLAEEAVMAYDAFSLGLLEVEAVSEQALELYVDRARASGFGGDFDLALDDLLKANELAPEREDILIFLAVALRSLERFDEAAQTIEQALSIFPDNPELLLERGNLRFDIGDVDAARLNWVMLVALHPDSYAGEIARSNIKKLNVLEEEGHLTPPKIEGEN
jgi:tetratricopeptide (TPR) repeat protein